jgi:hypothetical protein
VFQHQSEWNFLSREIKYYNLDRKITSNINRNLSGRGVRPTSESLYL